MGLDFETIRMLAQVPADLRLRGWSFVRRDSGMDSSTSGEPRHTAVYVRRHAPGIDPDPVPGGTVRNGYIRISTTRSRSTSWEDAFRDAVEIMRAIDAQRQEGP